VSSEVAIFTPMLFMRQSTRLTGRKLNDSFTELSFYLFASKLEKLEKKTELPTLSTYFGCLETNSNADF